MAQLKEVSAKQLKGVQLELTLSVFVHRLILARGTGLGVCFHWPCSRSGSPLWQERGEFLIWLFLRFYFACLAVFVPSDLDASQRYSEVAKLELQLQDQLPNAKASMFKGRLKYIEL